MKDQASYDSAMKRLRVAFKTWLARRRLIIEFCHDCGVEQPLVWTATDDLWGQLMQRTDGAGIVCPACFDARARARGLLLRWIPVIECGGDRDDDVLPPFVTRLPDGTICPLE